MPSEAYFVRKVFSGACHLIRSLECWEPLKIVLVVNSNLLSSSLKFHNDPFFGCRKFCKIKYFQMKQSGNIFKNTLEISLKYRWQQMEFKWIMNHKIELSKHEILDAKMNFVN